MKVLMIGASGVVGWCLFQSPLEGGHTVRCIARSPSTSERAAGACGRQDREKRAAAPSRCRSTAMNAPIS